MHKDEVFFGRRRRLCSGGGALDKSARRSPAATMLTNVRRFIGYLGRRSSWLFMEGFPLPEIDVSHFKSSIWLTTSLEGAAIARGTANALA